MQVTTLKNLPQNSTFDNTLPDMLLYWSEIVDRERVPQFPQDSCILEADSIIIEVSKLYNFNLSVPLRIIVKPNGSGWLVEMLDVPLYAYGETCSMAIHNIKKEIESLYSDLMEDDNYSDMWLEIKSLLSKIMRPT